jgi:hypothetical protein
MRRLSKMFVIAVGLLAVIVLSSSLYANDVLGTFTLSHPTQWNNTMLAPGDYTLRVTRTQSNADLLMIRGEKQTFNWFIYPEPACSTCQHDSLSLEVRGEDRVVTSLELMGFHADFDSHESAKEREKQLGKTRAHSEQVAVKVNSN